MINEDNNLKDTNLGLSLSLKDNTPAISYNKSNKLITALFMVTDILDKDEPLRRKLREIGLGIISDINSSPLRAVGKITEILSLLDIASSINLISEMNCSILKKEFLKLKQSIEEYSQVGTAWLEDFSSGNLKQGSMEKDNSLGQTAQARTRIGVQKGSTLMKALSKVEVSDRVSSDLSKSINNFDLLRKQRREDIISIVKTNKEGLTITDIKTKSKGPDTQSQALISCSEKTLQRELASMIVDGILLKTGEKRWSRYSLAKPLPSF